MYGFWNAVLSRSGCTLPDGTQSASGDLRQLLEMITSAQQLPPDMSTLHGMNEHILSKIVTLLKYEIIVGCGSAVLIRHRDVIDQLTPVSTDVQHKQLSFLSTMVAEQLAAAFTRDRDTLLRYVVSKQQADACSHSELRFPVLAVQQHLPWVAGASEAATSDVALSDILNVATTEVTRVIAAQVAANGAVDGTVKQYAADLSQLIGSIEGSYGQGSQLAHSLARALYTTQAQAQVDVDGPEGGVLTVWLMASLQLSLLSSLFPSCPSLLSNKELFSHVSIVTGTVASIYTLFEVERQRRRYVSVDGADPVVSGRLAILVQGSHLLPAALRNIADLATRIPSSSLHGIADMLSRDPTMAGTAPWASDILQSASKTAFHATLMPTDSAVSLCLSWPANPALLLPLYTLGTALRQAVHQDLVANPVVGGCVGGPYFPATVGVLCEMQSWWTADRAGTLRLLWDVCSKAITPDTGVSLVMLVVQTAQLFHLAVAEVLSITASSETEAHQQAEGVEPASTLPGHIVLRAMYFLACLEGGHGEQEAVEQAERWLQQQYTTSPATAILTVHEVTTVLVKYAWGQLATSRRNVLDRWIEALQRLAGKKAHSPPAHRLFGKVFHHCIQELRSRRDALPAVEPRFTGPGSTEGLPERANYVPTVADALLQEVMREVVSSGSDQSVVRLLMKSGSQSNPPHSTGGHTIAFSWVRAYVLSALSTLAPLQLNGGCLDVAVTVRPYLVPQDELYRNLLSTSTDGTGQSCTLDLGPSEQRRWRELRRLGPKDDVLRAGRVSASRLDLVLSQYVASVQSRASPPWPDLADATNILIHALYTTVRRRATPGAEDPLRSTAGHVWSVDPDAVAVVASYPQLVLATELMRELKRRILHLLRAEEAEADLHRKERVDVGDNAVIRAQRYLAVIAELVSAADHPPRLLTDTLGALFDAELSGALYRHLVRDGLQAVATFAPLMLTLARAVRKAVVSGVSGDSSAAVEAVALTAAFWAISSTVSDVGCGLACCPEHLVNICSELRTILREVIAASGIHQAAQLSVDVYTVTPQQSGAYHVGPSDGAALAVAVESCSGQGIRMTLHQQVHHGRHTDSDIVVRPRLKNLLAIVATNPHRIENDAVTADKLALLGAALKKRIEQCYVGGLSGICACLLVAPCTALSSPEEVAAALHGLDPRAVVATWEGPAGAAVQEVLVAALWEARRGVSSLEQVANVGSRVLTSFKAERGRDGSQIKAALGRARNQWQWALTLWDATAGSHTAAHVKQAMADEEGTDARSKVTTYLSALMIVAKTSHQLRVELQPSLRRAVLAVLGVCIESCAASQGPDHTLYDVKDGHSSIHAILKYLLSTQRIGDADFVSEVQAACHAYVRDSRRIALRVKDLVAMSSELRDLFLQRHNHSVAFKPPLGDPASEPPLSAPMARPHTPADRGKAQGRNGLEPAPTVKAEPRSSVKRKAEKIARADQGDANQCSSHGSEPQPRTQTQQPAKSPVPARDPVCRTPTQSPPLVPPPSTIPALASGPALAASPATPLPAHSSATPQWIASSVPQVTARPSAKYATALEPLPSAMAVSSHAHTSQQIPATQTHTNRGRAGNSPGEQVNVTPPPATTNAPGTAAPARKATKKFGSLGF